MLFESSIIDHHCAIHQLCGVRNDDDNGLVYVLVERSSLSINLWLVILRRDCKLVAYDLWYERGSFCSLSHVHGDTPLYRLCSDE